MIVVAGTWEFGWNSPIKELELWKYPLMDFGVDHLAMFPVSGIRDSFLTEFESLDSLLDHYAHLTSVVADEKGEEDLEDFEHPTEVLYLFGKASLSLLGSCPGKSVKISTNRNKGLLWPHQAASIILYDRWLSQL